MAFAPNPMFATFGTLTAIMIALALLVSLVVLPSMLVIATGQSMEVRAITDGRNGVDLDDRKSVLVGV
jgi:hypothetical protein